MAKITLESGDRFWCRAAGDNTTRYGIVITRDRDAFIISGDGRQGYTMKTDWVPDDFHLVTPDKLPAAVKLALDAVEHVLCLGTR